MTDVLILAAGLGTRMKSGRAKVLHELAGRPLIAHVIKSAMALNPEAIITVVGHQAEDVEQAVRHEAKRLSEQNATPQPLTMLTMPTVPKKCSGRERYFNRKRIVIRSKNTRKVREIP